jgi:hypothetical protein
MKVKRFRVSTDNILKMYSRGTHGPYEVIDQYIPKRSRILNVRLQWPYVVEFLIENADFREVVEGEEIPYFSAVLTGEL